MKKMPILEVLEEHNRISYALNMALLGDLVGSRILRFIQKQEQKRN
jgi:hypothetical protein